jgi:hypothetical protein
MARKVIRQPNGNYAVFSTVVDDFIIVNATKQELIDEDIKEAKETIQQKYDEMFEYFDDGKEPPHYLVGSPLTWEEAMERVTDVHGEEMAAKSLAAALPDK